MTGSAMTGSAVTDRTINSGYITESGNYAYYDDDVPHGKESLIAHYKERMLSAQQHELEEGKRKKEKGVDSLL